MEQSLKARKIQFLRQPEFLMKRLRLQIDQLGRLSEIAKAKPIVYSENKIFAPSLITSPNEDALVSCLELENQICKTGEEYNRVIQTIRNSLYEMPDAQEQLALESRYLNFYNWAQISDILGISVSRVFQVHRHAVEDIKLPV